MRPPTLQLTHPDATQTQLIALAREIPSAWVGLKIAALLLLLEGQRPGWITAILGLTRMSLTRWIHGVNAAGLEALRPKPQPGRSARLTPQVRAALTAHLEQSPQAFGLPRVPCRHVTVRHAFGASCAASVVRGTGRVRRVRRSRVGGRPRPLRRRGPRGSRPGGHTLVSPDTPTT